MCLGFISLDGFHFKGEIDMHSYNTAFSSQEYELVCQECNNVLDHTMLSCPQTYPKHDCPYNFESKPARKDLVSMAILLVGGFILYFILSFLIILLLIPFSHSLKFLNAIPLGWSICIGITFFASIAKVWKCTNRITGDSKEVVYFSHWNIYQKISSSFAPLDIDHKYEIPKYPPSILLALGQLIDPLSSDSKIKISRKNILEVATNVCYKTFILLHRMNHIVIEAQEHQSQFLRWKFSSATFRIKRGEEKNSAFYGSFEHDIIQYIEAEETETITLDKLIIKLWKEKEYANPGKWFIDEVSQQAEKKT